MGRIIYYVAASVDGYIADADGGVGWLPQGESGGDDFGYRAFYDQVDALAMGRRTYDQVLGFGEWPYAGKATYVFTADPPADNPYQVHFVRSEPADFVRTIASTYPGAVWLVGGGNLAEQFRRAGLIDEYRIFVIPVLLGRGTPLFGGDAPHTALELTELELTATQTHAGGIVALQYRPSAG